MSGSKIAALYGLIPNKLGFCGPRQEKLRNFIAGKITVSQIIPILKQFEAAYPYYQLIAKKNCASPFDKKVIKAYWVGNELLKKVTADDLRQLITGKFSKPGLLSKKEALERAKKIPEKSKPHHSFHVMVLGSITGSIDFTGKTKLKDICRIGWGKVANGQSLIANRSKKIEIIYQPLIGEKILKFGQPVKKEIIWDKNMIPKLKIGDWVSVHWGHAIQILSKSDINNLKKYTQNTINSLYGKK